MSTINWGIIGLGNIAYKFASGFDEVKNSKLVSIASKNNEKLEKFQKKFNIDKNFCFNEYEKVLLNNSNHKNIIENIDIGGPTMARSAAKNYDDVVILSNTNQYDNFIVELIKNKGSTSFNFREKLAEEAFM